MRWPALLVWLVLGSALLLAANGGYAVAVAAWLAPVLMLRFVRQAPAGWGLGLALVALLLTWAFQFQGMVPVGTVGFWLVMGAYALVSLVPYAADRFAARRLEGMASTLAFPLAWAASELLLAKVNPFGSWGAAAYTQWGNLPLLQVVALTGLAGVPFLIGWFAASLNLAWEGGFAERRAWAPFCACAAAIGLVMLGGGVRLALRQSVPRSVRVASFCRAERSIFPNPALEGSFSHRGSVPPEDMRRVLAYWDRIAGEMLARTEREAAAGAKVVVWSEVDVPVMERDEPALVARAQALARARGIYLAMALGTVDPAAERWLGNEVVMVTPTGEVAWRYLKARPVPGGEAAHSAPSDGRLRTLDTPYGRLAAAICFDMDFPDLLRQAGRSGAQIVLVPASDWRAIDPWHSQMAALRGIEEGFAVVRQTRTGMSMAVDGLGSVLAREDYYASSDHGMVAEVPLRPPGTPYSRLGDAFAWLCVAGAAVLLALAAVRRRAPSAPRAREAT